MSSIDLQTDFVNFVTSKRLTNQTIATILDYWYMRFIFLAPMPASSLNIRQILTEHFGKKPDDLWYVLADEYIDNVIDKFRSYLRKHEYILVVNENKFHILKLQTKANQTQIIEQYTYAISLLKNISIKEI